MKLIFGSILLVLSVVNCNRQLDAGEASANTIPLGYYSDYFVFIADDDQDDPLVVPIDINWTLHQESYDIEYKSWYGTKKDWPIEYVKNTNSALSSGIPKESYDHPSTTTFLFDKENKTITTTVKGQHTIKIQIPNEKEWVLATSESDFPTYAFRTSVELDSKNRSGWMVYERIRFDQLKDFDGFAAFYWMPIVVEGSLYHFVKHREEQTAIKWSQTEDSIIVKTVPSFDFSILETISDEKSKRSNIAKTVQIEVPEWEIDIILTSAGEQIGYGEEFPKGLAVFRQSLLQSSEQSTKAGYGMMELILAND